MHTEEMKFEEDDCIVVPTFKAQSFAGLWEFPNVLVQFAWLLRRRLLLIVGSNPYIFFDYRSGLDLVLSVQLGCGSYFVFLLLLISALFFLLYLFLAEVHSVAAVWWLLHPQTTAPTPSVITVLTAGGHCLLEVPSEAQRLSYDQS